MICSGRDKTETPEQVFFPVTCEITCLIDYGLSSLMFRVDFILLN